tara:strand:- start:5605 stop:6285 length:681 start_codon:yes stop_codon:yes gene_type:complete
MASYDFDDIHFNVNLKGILINILYIFTYIQNIFISIYDMFHQSYIGFYDSYFDKNILRVAYIDDMRNYENIYNIYIDVIYFLRCIFNLNKKKKTSIDYIYWLVNNNYEGFLIIDYFNKEHKKIIINLDLLKQENITINDINNILDNFISNDIKNDIIHVELDENDITDKFLLYKNSYKLDNIKVSDFIYLLNVIYNLNYNDSEITIKITDSEINENIYEHNKYINL